MLNLLNNPKFDNERNILNADLFVSNLKNTLKAFGFNVKVKYNVYRHITVYNISWNDDKTYNDIMELKREIGISLGINVSELKIKKISDNGIEIRVNNMKQESLSLKELLSMQVKDDSFKIMLGIDEEDKPVYFDFDKEKSLLVTGVTGIGKNNLFNNIIMNILINYSDVKVIILDSQSINYNQYSFVYEVVNEEKSIIDRIRSLRDEFEERIKTGNKERVVVFIDEIYEILKMDNNIKDDINYLLELGSMANIHLVVSTDSVMDDDINNLFDRDNVAKIAFYLTTRGEYNMFIGKVIKGNLDKDGMYLDSENNLTRITVPLIEDDEIERVVNYVKEKEKQES